MARPGLTGHRKFRRLARLLGSPVVARGALELLWDSCYESGDDYVGTAEDIETLIGWTGDPGILTRALVDAGAPEGQGFLEPVPGVDGAPTFRVHDLWHHAPDYVSNRRSRESERRREKSCRRCGVVFFAADPRSLYCSAACRQGGWRDRRVTDRNEHNGSATDSNSPPAPAPAPAPALAPTRTHEEKNGSSEPSSPVFLVFPTNGPVSEWTLSEAQIAEWVELYPGVDVRAQSRQALAWVRANKGRRKTANGMERFLVNWLNRENDKGGRTVPAALSASREYAWTCPHEPQCLGRHACQVKQTIAAGKARAS